MDFSLLVAFWIVSFSLVMTPGADWAYAISSGMRNRMLLPAVSGMLLGYVVITVVVAAGVGALVASVPVILTVLTYAGAAYLLWLGVGVLRNPPVPAAGNFDGEVNGLHLHFALNSLLPYLFHLSLR
ncbi:LysE family transporter [Enterobacter sp. JGM127]|nr:LysE family transporter [Enterobacter sp. JGM127]